MRPLILIAFACAAFAQEPDRLMSALGDRAMADQAMRLKTDDRISMYQSLVKAKPDDLHYHNLLAGAFIQKVRETTDFSYLDRASQVLENVISLDSQNYEALRLRSEVELERHNFKRVAEYSRQLATLAPNDSWNWGTLGDALVETGEYEGAAEAYQKMVSIRPDLSSYNRAAWYHFLAGDMPGAIEIMKRAIQSGSPSSENTAWCLVELGHLYMKSGKIAEAEQAYATAIKVFPGYHPGYAGLGRAQAAKGDVTAAIASFERAQASTPLPDYAAALYDLYSVSGKAKQAGDQMDLIDVIDNLGQAAKEKANRNLAIIYADHDHRVDRALELARAELEIRADIYTYDALAWALFKNNKLAEAEKAMAEAMKLSTPEPAFYYHAGMIANGLGKKKQANEFLTKALALNPHFDLRQAPVAEKALKEVMKEVAE
jgi:tetratricopeptide (TPR) repeat protein